jgi:hypothetical protein
MLERGGDEKEGKALNERDALNARSRDFEVENQSQTDF